MSDEDGWSELTHQQIMWCERLWVALKIGAEWHLPSVGVYQKTAPTELTLKTLHFSHPTPDALTDCWDSHDWVVQVGQILGWEIQAAIEEARDWEGSLLDQIPNDRIGDVAVCGAGCGTIIRMEPYQAGKYFTKMEKWEIADLDRGPETPLAGTTCPTCGARGFDDNWTGHFVVLDDTAARLKIMRAEGENVRGEEE